MQSNFDLPWLGMFIFSFMWFWVVAATVDINPLSFYYKSLYTNLFVAPRFWLQCLVGIGLAMVPIYAWLKYRQFFGGDPRHDIAYKARLLQDRTKKLNKVSHANIITER